MFTRRPALLTVLTAMLFLFSWLLPLAGCSRYDELVQKDQVAATKWADVEATLQRRYDLIPNLVETVKANAKFEKDALEAVTKARAEATQLKVDVTDPEAMKKFNEVQGQLKGSLSRLLVQAEKYPELKANESFRNLQVQLEGTENRILRAREEYNKAAGEYNAELGKIGGQAVNKVTGMPFKPREFFNMDAGAAAAPKVSL
ncbi:MAG: LemA family protein [Deltaproteobacteria bacterium]|nr:LemA family protein [Deltaproteobacteria bacterium]